MRSSPRPRAVPAILFSLGLAAAGTGHAQSGGAPTTLTSSGACSPIINQTTGNVTVICAGVGADALQALNAVLARKDDEISAKVAEANAWAEKYRALEAKLAETDSTGQVGQTAKAKLEKGDLAGAEAEVERLVAEVRRRDEDLRETRRLTRASIKIMAKQMVQNGFQPGGVFHADLRWSKPTLTVCFLDGAKPLRAYVASTALEWTLYGAVDFDFGPITDPRPCGVSDASDVRVSFEQMGFWAFLGTNSHNAEVGQPTANLELARYPIADAISGRFNGEVLHVFGHVLGFDHVMASPGSVCAEEIDYPKAYAFFGAPPNFWSKATVDANLRPPPNTKITAGAFDAKSVMNYALPAQIFKSGAASPCFVPAPQQLSLGDRLAVAADYP